MTNNELIGQEIIERVRKDNCFDFLRYFFAISLIIVHFSTLTEASLSWVVTGQTRVKAFFTITGFLVSYSYLRRQDIRKYAKRRLRRIMPAYVAVIAVCFVACIFVTSAPLSHYLFSLHTLKYWLANLSMLNFIEPSLPGLFEHHYETAVNGSLWSMKYEALFYLAVPLFVWLMRRFGKSAFLVAVLLFHLTYRITANYLEATHPDSLLFHSLNHGSHNTFVYFLSGMALLLYFDWFCRHIRILLPVTALLIIVGNFVYIPLLYYLDPLIFSAFIIGIAYFCRPLNFLQRYDNISYGLYLYHYPIIQILLVYGLPQNNLYLSLFLTLLFTTICALLSWYLIEKPILNNKKTAAIRQ